MTSVNEYDAVAGAVQHYLDGGRAGKSATMKLGFHEGATIFGYLGPDLIAGPIQGLYDWVDSNPAASELEARLGSVDVTGAIAAVRVEIDNWSGHRFTDILTLLKVDGQWKIISKVFHLHHG